MLEKLDGWPAIARHLGWTVLEAQRVHKTWPIPFIVDQEGDPVVSALCLTSWQAEFDVACGRHGGANLEMAMAVEELAPVAVRPRYVYFVEGSGLLNIGVAMDVRDRVASLQVGSPVKLVIRATFPGGHGVERQFHERWAAHHSHGEWFKPCPEIKRFIADHCIPWSES